MENLQVVIEQQAGMVSFNFEEMKAFLNERLEEYRTAVFTDDSIKSAKSYTAQLRKEQAALKGRVTEVKREYMQPFDDFKAKADELIRIYDEPINFIDGQVKDFEERRKAEKRKLIGESYVSLTKETAQYIPLERIYNPKWENATYKINDIKKEIVDASNSVLQAIETICGMKSESCDKALELYKKDLSLTNAITYINNYERQKAEILLKEQERQRKEEEERIRREERERIAEEQRQKAEIEAVQLAAQEEKEIAVEEAKTQAAQEVVESLTPDVEEKAISYFYKISLGEEGKKAFEMYMDSVGIEWQLM